MKTRTISKIFIASLPFGIAYYISGITGLKVFLLVAASLLGPIFLISLVYLLVDAKPTKGSDVSRDVFYSPKYFWHSMNVFNKNNR